MSSKKIALIPAYEPGELMLDMLEQLVKDNFIVVVVDDGSGPLYSEKFQMAEAFGTVLKSDINRGKGEALKCGMRYIKRHFNGDDIVITIDADGQHRVQDADRVYVETKENENVLVLGSRAFNTEVPFRSKFGNVLTKWIFGRVSGNDINDTQTGLRGFKVELIDDFLKISGSRYEYEMNILLYCNKMGVKIKEVPIETIYLNENEASHFSPMKDSIKIYEQIIKFSASSFLSFLLDYGLFTMFVSLLGLGVTASGLIFSNVTSRIFSATFNFLVNRNKVFKSKGNLLKAAVQYGALAMCILFVNTVLLTSLVGMVRVNIYVAKMAVEICMFFVSFFIQRKLIFPVKERNKNHDKVNFARMSL